MQNIGELLSKKYKSSIKYLNALEILSVEWEKMVGSISQYIVPESIYLITWCYGV